MRNLFVFFLSFVSLKATAQLTVNTGKTIEVLTPNIWIKAASINIVDAHSSGHLKIYVSDLAADVGNKASYEVSLSFNRASGGAAAVWNYNTVSQHPSQSDIKIYKDGNYINIYQYNGSWGSRVNGIYVLGNISRSTIAIQLYPNNATSSAFTGTEITSSLPTSFWGANVAIGTATPDAKLHVQGSTLGGAIGDRINLLTLKSGGGSGGNWSHVDMYTYRNAAGNDWLTSSTRIQQSIDGTKMAFVEFNPPGMRWGMALGSANQYRLYISEQGQVGIGTDKVNNAAYKLFVETGIRTRKVRVDQDIWADYVFEPSYKLPTLKEVEAFIKEHKHLPDVPSADEVKKEGIDLGSNQVVLLKKIEELTLYIIEQNKKLEDESNKNKQLEMRIKKLEGTLN